MMTQSSSLVLAVFVPVLGAFVLPFVGRISLRARNLSALAFILAPLLYSCLVIPVVLAGQTIVFTKSFPLGFNLILTADGLAVFMAIVSSLISAIIVLYSFGYISHYENQNELSLIHI